MLGSKAEGSLKRVAGTLISKLSGLKKEVAICLQTGLSLTTKHHIRYHVSSISYLSQSGTCASLPLRWWQALELTPLSVQMLFVVAK